MSGEISMNPGECGVVKSVDNVFGDIQYGVKWDNGSSLALLSDADAWKLEKKQIKEDELEKTFKVPGGLIVPFIGMASILWLLTSLNKWEILSTIIFITTICLVYFVMKWMRNN